MAGVQRAHILVADADADIRHLITDLLASAGHEVTAVASGRQALDAVTRFTPDLALLEAALPDLSGFEVCRRLQAKGPSAPAVIFVTARGSTADRGMGLDLGAVDYVVKPFEPQEFAARVRAALRQKAARDALAASAA